MEDVENMNLLRQASLKTKYGLSFKEQVSRPPHLLFGHCGLAIHFKTLPGRHLFVET